MSWRMDERERDLRHWQRPKLNQALQCPINAPDGLLGVTDSAGLCVGSVGLSHFRTLAAEAQLEGAPSPRGPAPGDLRRQMFADGRWWTVVE